MNSMTDSDRYNGYANRETWAFNLHWQNDQGLYNETLEVAREAMREPDGYLADWSDSQLGERVVGHWRDTIMDLASNGELTEGLDMFRSEVGSWWRIDYDEVGAAVRESLDAESDD